jgi:hypothetical protein
VFTHRGAKFVVGSSIVARAGCQEPLKLDDGVDDDTTDLDGGDVRSDVPVERFEGDAERGGRFWAT